MSAKVTLSGRLTKDPELRFTDGGKPVVKFSVVTARRLKNNAGEWEEQGTSFWDCTAFGDIAENIAESFTKGTAVLVTGNMQQEKWQTKEGENRYWWKVMVDDAGPSLKYQVVKNESAAGYNDPPF